MSVDPAHAQRGHRVRLEWGPTGAAAVTPGADVAVVVDVLSFSTTVTVALDRGITVHPVAWQDERAAALADDLGATLAVRRQDARGRPGSVSLSPQSLQQATGVERIVLPSPNGATICDLLAGSGATVVLGCLRNGASVGAWLAERLAAGATVGVVAAGERWPDGSLRPAVEDLWGAGAVLAGLDPALLGPEAAVARHAYDAFRTRPGDLLACASGQELVAKGFEADVRVAGALDASDVVPVLRDGAFAPTG